MPAVGLYERFCGLHEALCEDFQSLTNVDLIYDATCGPIYEIAKAHHEGGLPKYIAIERIRQHVDWVKDNFGLIWEDSTWEQYLEGDWEEFDGMFEFHLWDIFVDQEANLASVIDGLGGDVDPDPLEVVNALCKVATFVALFTYDYGWVYVFKSPFTWTDGLQLGPEVTPHLVGCPVDVSREGDADCHAVPPLTINKAIDLEYSYECTCAVDGNLEVYRCQT